MELAFRSEKGAPVTNEDACLANAELGLFIVCDGLGKSGGEIASRMAAEALEKWIKNHQEIVNAVRASPDKEKRKALKEMLDAGAQEVSRVVFEAAAADPQRAGMCTTLDVILLLGSYVFIIHVGSGRVYLLRQDEVHQLTEDHTQLAHLRRSGKLDSYSANQHASFARRLTRAAGFQDHVKVDVIDVEIQSSDRFLMVSDGVWMHVGEKELEKILKMPVPTTEILKRLHDEVSRHGAKDNYTTVVFNAPEVKAVAQIGTAEQKIKMLGKVPVFEYLGYQELIHVLNTGDLFKVPPGKEICREGDPGGEMMLILSGAVEIRKNQQTIRTLNRGDVVGELSMIDAAPRSASVVAMEATNLLAFPRASLFTLFREHPDLAVKFLWGLTMETNKRLRMASNKLVGQAETEGLEASRVTEVPFLRSN